MQQTMAQQTPQSIVQQPNFLRTANVSAHTHVATQQQERSSNLPEKKFAAGGISATIWANEKEVNGAPVHVHTVSLTRTYKGADGQWKQSASMRVNDIPKAQLVLDKAFEYLTLKDNTQTNTQTAMQTTQEFI